MKDCVVNALTFCSFSGFVLIEELLEIEVTQRLYLPDEIAALVAAIVVALAYGLVSKYVFVRRNSKTILSGFTTEYGRSFSYSVLFRT